MRKIILFALALLLTAPMFSEELSRGKMKIVLDESQGSFSIFDISDRENPVSLFSDEDPRTSALYILVDNRIFHLGKNSSFRQAVEESDDYISFVWTSSTLKITQKFSFIFDSSNSVESGVKMDVTIENTSDSSINLGVRLLFDTYLSEDENKHFILAGGEELSKERSFTSATPAYWVSGSPVKGTSLQVMLNHSGTTEPSQIVFANWKRLDSANWAYNSRSRNFNYLPYSVNDSAVSQWYETQSLASDAERVVSVSFGLYDPSGFSSRVASSTANIDSGSSGETSSEDGSTPSESEKMIAALRDDLAKVNFVLGEFEKVFLGDQELTDDDIVSLESLVKELEERYKQYQDQ